MPFVERGDKRIHYQLDGPSNAPTLVFSNSLGTNLSMWDPQIPALTRHFRVLRYDTLGHGQSSAPPGPYTIESLARDVVAMLDALGIDRAHFCGISMGGVTGIWLGIHAANRVNNLILCSTGAHIGNPDIWNSRIKGVREKGMPAVAFTVADRWFTKGFVASNPQIIEATQQMLLQTPVEGYVGCCEAIRDADLRSDAGRIKALTLVISGTHDPATPPENGHFLAETIRGSRYVELPASHLSNLELPRQFTDALLKFLNQAEAKDG